MTLILSGSNGVSDVDGTAATPAIRGTDANTGIFFPAADTIAFAEGGVESMRLDSSGNLGLGVTPSAWNTSFYRALQVGAGASIFASPSNGAAAWLSANAFFNSSNNNTYITTAAATQYRQLNGEHAWFTAPSGTAGNAISFTQAMTLDASGNLLVGATSGSGQGERLFVSRLNANNNQPVFAWTDNQDNTGYLSVASATEVGENGASISSDGALFFGRRISGSFTERARIDSSGNLLVGTTSSAGRITVLADSGNNVAAFRSAGAVSATRFARFDVNTSTEVGSIQYNGTGTSYVTTSDYRLKENIAPMTGALAKVALLKPCSYTWKSNGERDEGFIAHELAEVCPRAVSGEKDAVNEDGSIKPQGIDTSFLVATLTAALQEQQAIITALTERVAALEAK